MVCDYRDMSGHDHIQGGGWSLVSSDVRCAFDRQGLGMDWRWKSGNPRTAACESATFSHPTLDLSGNVDILRLLVDVIHHQYCHSTGTPEHDGYVPLRIRHPYQLVILHRLPILHIFD